MKQGNNKKCRKKSLFAILLLVFCTQFISVFPCSASGNEQYVSLNSSLKNGELPTTTAFQNYKEFESDNSLDDIAFMSDYRPVNLLSNKEIISKTSFLQNSKVVYNTEHPHNYWGLVTTIY